MDTEIERKRKKREDGSDKTPWKLEEVWRKQREHTGIGRVVVENKTLK